MFHRSVTLSQNHNPRPPLRGMSVQNENSLNSNQNIKNSTTARTPNQQQQHRPQRRALGDISNSKSNSSAKPGSSGIPTLKRQQGALTPRSQIPRLTTATTKTTIPSKIKPKSQSSQKNKSSSSSSLLPSRTIINNSTARKKTQAKLAPSVSSKTSVSTTIRPPLEPVDDVELPAGRTFLQQQLNGDDDDDYSTSSIGSDFKITTMWDDWGSSLKQQYLQEELDLEQKDDIQVQAHIDRVLREQDEGTNE
jgi:hypothetical protein